MAAMGGCGWPWVAVCNAVRELLLRDVAFMMCHRVKVFRKLKAHVHVHIHKLKWRRRVNEPLAHSTQCTKAQEHGTTATAGRPPRACPRRS